MNPEACALRTNLPSPNPEGSVPRYVIAKAVPARQKARSIMRNARCHFDFRHFFRLTVVIAKAC